MRIGASTLALAALTALLRAQAPVPAAPPGTPQAPPAAVQPAPAQAPPAAVDPSYAEGKRLFDTLDYENAIKQFDAAIASLQGTATDPPRRDMLASAYELRARARFGTGDQDGARADFGALLKIQPDFTLTGQISPRVVTLFDEVAQAQVTSLKLSVTPPSATVTIDGRTVPAGTVKIAVGDHVVTADQRGYSPFRQSVTAVSGTAAELTVTLTRVSAALNILTSPPDVEVTLDGASIGKTVAGPAGPQFAEALAQAKVASSAASSALSVPEVKTGPHVIRFSRLCHVSSTVNLTVDKAEDYTVGPVILQPATARVSITSSTPDSQVFLNGESRGAAPLDLPALCEGDYTVELRSPTGHFSNRITVKAGEAQTIAAVLRPAFALVSSAGKSAGADVRVLVERALARGTRNVDIFAPPADRAAAAVEAAKVPPEWMAFDANGKSLSASAQIVQAIRGDASAKLAAAFNAQGVASVTLLDDGRIVLALLAAGSTTPDIIELRLDKPESIAAALDRLGRSPAFFKPAIGVTAVDVADVAGAVIVGVDQAIAASGLAAGDVIVAANAKPVANVAALAAVLDDRKANDPVTLDVSAAAGGAKKQAALKAFMTPRLISLYEPDVLANRVLVDLRAQLAAAATGDAVLQSTIRLNLAVALGRSGDWIDARTELQKVQLPAGSGVGEGTVQYLLGLAADQLGNRAEAEAALRKAVTTGGLVTEDGPSVRDLAEAKLADLAK